MFTIYLVIIGLIAPWKESCERQNGNYSVSHVPLAYKNTTPFSLDVYTLRLWIKMSKMIITTPTKLLWYVLGIEVGY